MKLGSAPGARPRNGNLEGSWERAGRPGMCRDMERDCSGQTTPCNSYLICSQYCFIIKMMAYHLASMFSWCCGDVVLGLDPVLLTEGQIHSTSSINWDLVFKKATPQVFSERSEGKNRLTEVTHRVSPGLQRAPCCWPEEKQSYNIQTIKSLFTPTDPLSTAR